MLNISNIRNSLVADARIDGGYGEYIVHSTTDQLLDKTTYERCYQALLRAKQFSKESEKQEFLKREISQINPAIKTFFIPRTLYELCFIEKCFEETLRLGGNCKNRKYGRINEPAPECWHGAYFHNDFGNDQDPIIIALAHRLNNSIVQDVKQMGMGSAEALRYEQITSMANKKLDFLKTCHEASKSQISRKLSDIIDNRSDIVNNMISEIEGPGCRPLGITTDLMKRLVLNAIALECSNAAKGNYILYRGLKKNDRPLEYDAHGNVSFVQSISFGTGLFAGGMYDPGAAAFHYMRNEDSNAFAILIPQQEESTSIFAIPKTHSLCQMFGRGERWHPRSRAPTINVRPEISVGCKTGQNMGTVGSVPPHFQLGVTPRQFEEKYQYYTNNCLVNLKPPTRIEVDYDHPGKRLFLRGTGSWDRSRKMTLENGKWVIEIKNAPDFFEYKFLVDHQDWEPGKNHVAKIEQSQLVKFGQPDECKALVDDRHREEGKNYVASIEQPKPLSEQERRDEKDATETLKHINPELAFNQLQGFAKEISTSGFDKGKFPFSSIGKHFEGRVDYHMYFIHKAKGKTQNIDNYGKHAFDNKDNKFGTTNEERLEAIRRAQIEIALMSLVKILNSPESKDLKTISSWVDRLGQFEDHKYENMLYGQNFKLHEEKKLPRDGWNFGRWSFRGEEGKNADPLLKLEAVRRLQRELVDSLFKQAEPASQQATPSSLPAPIGNVDSLGDAQIHQFLDGLLKKTATDMVAISTRSLSPRQQTGPLTSDWEKVKERILAKSSDIAAQHLPKEQAAVQIGNIAAKELIIFIEALMQRHIEHFQK